jgi:hypothetical protein
MNRKEMLELVVNHAQFNGFEFRRWFQLHVRQTWPGTEEALHLLASEGRYYTLLFSHEFARCFWRAGARIRLVVPAVTYERVTTSGDVVVVKRKAFTRRSVKSDVWGYHLRQMAAADDPLRYLLRFLPASDAERAENASTERKAAEA